MPNVINSIGYSLGKLHAGMICYLCDLWNEGKKTPLRQFLNELGVQANLPDNIQALKEFMNIDLVISDCNRTPLIVIEIKVDDHEHQTTKNINGEKKRGPQTEIYAHLFEDDVKKLFVTLGAGEFYYHKVSGGFTWIRLSDFIKAVSAAAESSEDVLIGSWRDALKQEKDRQDKAIRNIRETLSQYRDGCWNIYVLGYLKERILASAESNILELIDPTVYMYGKRPDTILNFGWKKYDARTFPIYTEICNDGHMRIKMCFEAHDIFSDIAVKQRIATDLEEVFFSKFNDFEKERSARNTYRNTKTKTLLKLKVGLINDAGLLRFENTVDDAAKKVIAALDAFDEIRSSGKIEKIRDSDASL